MGLESVQELFLGHMWVFIKPLNSSSAYLYFKITTCCALEEKVDLLKKIQTKEARIGIIGLGYVGLPLVFEFCKAGFNVTGFDNDGGKIQSLKKGKSYIKHIAALRIKECAPLFTPTNDFSLLSTMDCVIICVPTPLNKYREPDLSYVFDTTKTIARYLHKDQLIVLESTTYPGTTDEDMKKILEGTGLRAGKDFYLAYSP